MEKHLEDLEKASRGLDARDQGLMLAARIGLIMPPARLSNRFEIYEQTINELYQMLFIKLIYALRGFVNCGVKA